MNNHQSHYRPPFADTDAAFEPGARSTAKNFSYFTPWLFVLTAIWVALYGYVFPDPLSLAAERWPLIVLGLCGAVIGNITAIGGGLVFIPAMLFFYRLDPVSALKLAFVTQAVGMSSGASGWLRRGGLPLHLLRWTVPTLLLGTAISTFWIHPQPILVKALFGPVAFMTGLLTLLTLGRSGGLNDLPGRAHVPLLAVSCIGGMITGWVAIGEGEIIAAFCMLAYGLKADRAVGLGVLLLSLNSVLLALLHVFYFGGVPWDMAVFTMLGTLWGGRLGPLLAQRIKQRTVKKTFAAVAVLDGLAMSFQAVYVTFFH